MDKAAKDVESGMIEAAEEVPEARVYHASGMDADFIEREFLYMHPDIELADESGDVRYMVLALRKSDGKVLWEREAHRGRPAGGRYRRNTFGSETPATDGERICYVVDMSDSMLKEIAPSARPEGPITGPKQKKKRELLDEGDLPWHKIKTRWDLAREQLRVSLLRLTPDKHFSVVWFGDSADTLDATKGLVKATKANVDRAIAELDSIKATEAPERTDGRPRKTGMVLRGSSWSQPSSSWRSGRGRAGDCFRRWLLRWLP